MPPIAAEAVQEVCHDNLKRPKSWSQFREMAYTKGPEGGKGIHVKGGFRL